MRNKDGLDGADVGLGNEKSINQLVAHHAIIFRPAQQQVWISTAPWQLGKFVCYDLKKIFGMKMTNDREIYDTCAIKPDPFLATRQYLDFRKFSTYRFPFQSRTNVPPDSLVKWNPNSYLSYMLAGDVCFQKNDFASARHFYETGLAKEIASQQERDYMMTQLNHCKKHQP